MVGGATGLIPSQFLEEKRKAFVPRDFDGSGESTLAGPWDDLQLGIKKIKEKQKYVRMRFVGHQAAVNGVLLPSAGERL